MNANFKDLRLIEAFDYIDPKYIAEVGESLKLRSVAEPQSTTYTKPSPFKYWKQYVAIVACALLLSMAFPVFGYIAEVINTIASGWGDVTSQISENTNLPEVTTEFIKEVTSSDINTEHETVETEPAPDYLRYFPELEDIDEETMLKIKSAWAQLQYDIYYPQYYSNGLREGYSEEEAKEIAIKKATQLYETAFNDFFDSINFFFYGYLGTLNDYIVLASYSNWTKPITGLTIGGVDFGTQAIFYIYVDENLIRLEEAYENDLVSYEELLLIKARNEQYRVVAIEYYANQFRDAQQGKG